MNNRKSEVAKLNEALDAKSQVLDARAEDLGELRKSVDADREKIQEKLDAIEEKVAGIKAERDELAAKIKPNVLKRYESITVRRGLAVVPVRNQACTGCNMNIPPQLYNTLHKGDSIETCPYCKRIVYWEGCSPIRPR